MELVINVLMRGVDGVVFSRIWFVSLSGPGIDIKLLLIEILWEQ
jgi:hypothetical protein